MITRAFAGLLLVAILVSCACTPSADSTSSTLGPAVTEAGPGDMPGVHGMSDFSGTAVNPHGTMTTADTGTAGAPGDSRTIVIDDLAAEAPQGWIRKQAAMGMIQDEFSVPPAEGDQQSGRATVMRAGGTPEANIDRWKGQFTKADGSPVGDDAKVEKLDAAGKEITLVDISGTYKDSPGPFAPSSIDRPGYRMLAAIIPLGPQEAYFIKFYGPAKTVAQNEQAFRSMVQGIKRT